MVCNKFILKQPSGALSQLRGEGVVSRILRFHIMPLCLLMRRTGPPKTLSRSCSRSESLTFVVGLDKAFFLWRVSGPRAPGYAYAYARLKSDFSIPRKITYPQFLASRERLSLALSPN